MHPVGPARQAEPDHPEMPGSDQSANRGLAGAQLVGALGYGQQGEGGGHLPGPLWVGAAARIARTAARHNFGACQEGSLMIVRGL